MAAILIENEIGRHGGAGAIPLFGGSEERTLVAGLGHGIEHRYLVLGARDKVRIGAATHLVLPHRFLSQSPAMERSQLTLHEQAGVLNGVFNPVDVTRVRVDHAVTTGTEVVLLGLKVCGSGHAVGHAPCQGQRVCKHHGFRIEYEGQQIIRPQRVDLRHREQIDVLMIVPSTAGNHEQIEELKHRVREVVRVHEHVLRVINVIRGLLPTNFKRAVLEFDAAEEGEHHGVFTTSSIRAGWK